MTWRGYHDFTKHSVESLRRSPHVLDWANMPDPFRHYEGVPVLDLPADPQPPGTPATSGPEFLSQLLFYSAAISASKRVPSTGYRYALRVNPSSGNLHPTEFHFATHGLKQWPDGLYHYRPSSHMAEQRALGPLDLGFPAPIVFVLTSIAWREAWKYRDRAYRYCLHDIGHAWQSLALAAHAMGCETFATGHFPDDDIAERCRLHDDEWPMLIVALRGRSIPLLDASGGEGIIWHGGRANVLSEETIGYQRIDAMHAATKLDADISLPSAFPAESPAVESRGLRLPPPAPSDRPFGEVVRARRSALDFIGGSRSISLPQLAAILAAAARPLAADFESVPFVQLYLYVHRVDDLPPGVYRFWPEQSVLELIRPGDQRVAAAGLSLGQDLAGNACVAFSMIADLHRATRLHGDRGYRYVHFEAGAVGQRLYVAAESLGLGATGIGAFYDDEVHRYLGLEPGGSEAVYHFAIGYPIPDPRVEAGH